MAVVLFESDADFVECRLDDGVEIGSISINSCSTDPNFLMSIEPTLDVQLALRAERVPEGIVFAAIGGGGGGVELFSLNSND